MTCSQFTGHRPFWEQIRQVQELQERTVKYLNIHQRSIIAENETNQFLNSHQQYSQSDIEPLFLDKSDCHAKSQVDFNEKESVFRCELPVAESHYIAPHSQIHLSRIFDEIQLGEEIVPSRYSNVMQVELWFGEELLKLELSRRDLYNLSNFSSFNNNKAKEDPIQYEFKDLLEKIQQKVGRTLSQQGITNIINQIEEAITIMSDRNKEEEEIMRDCCEQRSDNDKTVKNVLVESSLTQGNSNISENPQSKFDLLLNNKIFNKAKPFSKKHQQDQRKSIVSEFRSSFINENNKQDKHNCKKIKQKSTLGKRNINKNEEINKQNGNEDMLKPKKEATVLKQLKIVRKNNIRGALVMIYNDMKNVENFCIVNKLYGKEKDKIIKAVQTNKTVINLQ